jgi:hypothetical protein
VPFSIVESDWIATNAPLTPTIFPNTSNKNFEIAILFSIVVFQIDNMFLRRRLPHKIGARVLSYGLGSYKVFNP